MTDSKHTPGPWHLDEEGDVTSADGKKIAMFLDATDGDAKLFLAAPDMLEALRAAKTTLAIAGIGPEHETSITIRAAIAKATAP